MAKRKSSRRRSRKSPPKRAPQERPGEPAEPASSASVAAPERPVTRRSSSSPRRARPARGARRGDGAEGRPHAPWHPLPLSELLILVGAVGVVVAVFVQAQPNTALLLASIAAVAIGTFEVTLREHLAGFRSHTVLLAVVPVVVLHSAALLVTGAFASVPRWVNIPLLALDIAIFSVLYKLLRLRYLDARRERRFAG
ncbi:MAG TPA: hypothetical protein VLZ06_05260 [Solirubrobacteraceae bacterium]|nr:hypothetical protein [Solirubrobacteraceae bacterium]